MLLPPQFLAVLAMFCAAFGMAALPIYRSPRSERRPPFGRLVPHPSQPGSMLSFVALSSFLTLVSLARFGLMAWPPVDPVNSPDSNGRWWHAPPGVDIDFVADGPSGSHRFTYPHNIADLTVDAARRVESATGPDRVRAVRDLAWWTCVCPNYAQFALPRLVRALEDPDPHVKGAAAIGLGSTGGHGAPAVPGLLGARGTTVAYFDYLVAEAVFLIEHSPRWEPASECEAVPMDELESRIGQQGEL